APEHAGRGSDGLLEERGQRSQELDVRRGVLSRSADRGEGRLSQRLDAERRGPRSHRGLARVPVLRLASFLVLACLAVGARGAGARVLLTRDAALRQAF